MILLDRVNALVFDVSYNCSDGSRVKVCEYGIESSLVVSEVLAGELGDEPAAGVADSKLDTSVVLDRGNEPVGDRVPDPPGDVLISGSELGSDVNGVAVQVGGVEAKLACVCGEQVNCDEFTLSAVRLLSRMKDDGNSSGDRQGRVIGANCHRRPTSVAHR